MRIRITIEYDPDWLDEDIARLGTDRLLAMEKNDWNDGSVNVYDIEAIGEPNGKVKWEIIP